MKFIMTLLLFTVYGFGFEYHLEPYTVTEGVECFFGLYGKAKEENGGRVLNTCYIESDAGYVVIDSGPTYSYAQQAYSVMQRKKALPVKYVINTSTQETHILGNQFYKEQGATLIGPKSYEEIIANNETPTLSSQLSVDTFVNTRLTALDIYLNADKNLTVGSLQLELKKLNQPNSQYLIVNLPDQKIIFAGEYLYNRRTPLAKHSTVEWSQAIKKIESISWERIIASHGIKMKRTALQSTKKYLHNLLAKTETKKIKPKKIAKKDTKKDTKKISKKNIPNIHYTDFERAKSEAIRDNKLIMIKVEASHCKPCDRLNTVLATNNNIKKMVNRHIKAVKINTDYANVPMGLSYMGTPTVFLIQPKDERVLMQLEGSMAAKELEASLKLFVHDGFRVGLASL
jgi:glyoxylase-like metal-dependent hydrolase (beta-lactamase superfamily II)